MSEKGIKIESCAYCGGKITTRCGYADNPIACFNRRFTRGRRKVGDQA